jgi:hypothetical protein
MAEQLSDPRGHLRDLRDALTEPLSDVEADETVTVLATFEQPILSPEFAEEFEHNRRCFERDGGLIAPAPSRRALRRPAHGARHRRAPSGRRPVRCRGSRRQSGSSPPSDDDGDDGPGEARHPHRVVGGRTAP